MTSAEAWHRLLVLGDVADDDYDEAAVHKLVHLLHQRGEAVVVDLAVPVLRDADWWRRAIAARVLGQLGYERGRPFGAQVMPALIAAARSEADDFARASMVDAIGAAEDPVWSPELLRYATDSDAGVRRNVASGLPLIFAGEDMSDEAISALIELTCDLDPEVRDWATFSLGVQSRFDTDAIRAALLARLDDPEGDTRFEATLGLARRGDRRVLPHLQRRLGADPETIYLLDLGAAAELADPSLLVQLSRLGSTWADDDDRHSQAVRYAIDRCAPTTHELARSLEENLVASINEGVADLDWSVGLSGAYPLTIVSVRRPDGAEHEQTLLWEDVNPTEFNLDQQTRNWVEGTRARVEQ